MKFKNNTLAKHLINEEKVYFELFGAHINLIVDNYTSADSQIFASQLNNLPEKTIKSLCEATSEYCNNKLYAIGKSAIQFEKTESILCYLRPILLLVSFEGSKRIMTLNLEFECSLLNKSVIEWVIQGDTILHVGSFYDNPQFCQ
ncbi:DUF6985 domain-containing protein [Pleionea sediminis]|uniref:DUF6985 domain-containing protein n=1 Tax=Pleionea sediminis TaxID=2569479 RepID=UPI0011864A5C|nr:hypothetical protein [Pleionea sediminis]